MLVQQEGEKYNQEQLQDDEQEGVLTTETLESAMAADPIHGCILRPRGEKTPAATGTPTRLYTQAKRKFR